MLVGDLAPQMQKLVASLEIGVPSEPLSFAEGVASMMVCDLLDQSSSFRHAKKSSSP